MSFYGSATFDIFVLDDFLNLWMATIHATRDIVELLPLLSATLEVKNTLDPFVAENKKLKWPWAPKTRGSTH